MMMPCWTIFGTAFTLLWYQWHLSIIASALFGKVSQLKRLGKNLIEEGCLQRRSKIPFDYWWQPCTLKPLAERFNLDFVSSNTSFPRMMLDNMNRRHNENPTVLTGISWSGMCGQSFQGTLLNSICSDFAICSSTCSKVVMGMTSAYYFFTEASPISRTVVRRACLKSLGTVVRQRTSLADLELRLQEHLNKMMQNIYEICIQPTFRP